MRLAYSQQRLRSLNAMDRLNWLKGYAICGVATRLDALGFRHSWALCSSADQRSRVALAIRKRPVSPNLLGRHRQFFERETKDSVLDRVPANSVDFAELAPVLLTRRISQASLKHLLSGQLPFAEWHDESP
jgi:hypothetical protein